MPRKRRPADSSSSLLDDIARTYDEWQKWSDYHSHLIDRELAMSSSMAPRGSDEQSKTLSRRVNQAFKQFDRAIFEVIARDKTAVRDARIIERIRLAQNLGDATFFADLGQAFKKNVKADDRLWNVPEAAILLRCAIEYLNDRKTKYIREEYRRWEEFSIDKRRRLHPNDRLYQSMVDQWAETKDNINKNTLEEFRSRVKRMADDLARGKLGSTPIPLPHD